MHLIVYGDFNCPYSYLASQRVDELARFPRLALAGEPVCREGAMVHGHASLPVTAR